MRLSILVRLSLELGGQLLSLREAYISNLGLLQSLEPLEKFVVVVVSNSILVISLKSRMINEKYTLT